MKTIFLVFIIVLLSTFFFSSCYYDKEQLLYGNDVCTEVVTAASYSQNVVPVLQQYCYSCHSGGFPSGNIVMGNYAADKALASKGSLYGSINHSFGYKAMPQGGAKLGSCQIARIKKWIDDGMLNN